MIRAIETHYRGYRFRSRLEARWAVFFDAMGIEWQYESQGFMLPSGPYLPDFFLPRWDLWFEVKGKRADDEELEMCRELSHKDNGVLLAVGGVGDRPLKLFAFECCDSGGGSYEFDCAFAKTTSGAACFVASLGRDDRRIVNSEWDDVPHVYDCLSYMAPWGSAESAVRAARSARFEHGERAQ